MEQFDFPKLIENPVKILPELDRSPVTGIHVILPVLIQTAFGAAAHTANKNGHPVVKVASAFAMAVGTGLVGVGLRTGSAKVRDAGGYLFSAGMLADGVEAASGLKLDKQTVFGAGVTAMAAKYGKLCHGGRGKAGNACPSRVPAFSELSLE